jgi:hypothetical protein
MTPYRPFLAGPWRLSMGLKALDPADWIEIDADLERDLAQRRDLLSTRRSEVLAALPEAAAGQTEVLGLLLEHLPRRFPEHYQRTDAGIDNRTTGERFALADWQHAPLELAGRLVQEDLCLMQASPAGYRLVAAVLCFPAHWRLADKLGQPLAGIHAPVPGFTERLAGPVDRFFANLQTERPVWRLNWSLTGTPARFLPHRSQPVEVTADTAGERLWLRVERQTLRRLPASGDVLFGIRTYVTALAAAIDGPAAARALAERIGELPAATATYKAIAPCQAPLLAYLEHRAHGAGRDAAPEGP